MGLQGRQLRSFGDRYMPDIPIKGMYGAGSWTVKPEPSYATICGASAHGIKKLNENLTAYGAIARAPEKIAS